MVAAGQPVTPRIDPTVLQRIAPNHTVELATAPGSLLPFSLRRKPKARPSAVLVSIRPKRLVHRKVSVRTPVLVIYTGRTTVVLDIGDFPLLDAVGVEVDDALWP